MSWGDFAALAQPAWSVASYSRNSAHPKAHSMLSHLPYGFAGFGAGALCICARTVLTVDPLAPLVA